MAVRIRMKRLGRRHRPFYRICAMDARKPRNGRVIEELGYYDPMVKETDARAVLNAERIDYWLGVGAQPSEKVNVLIKKYGSNGTHLENQKQAMERLKIRPKAPAPVAIPRPEPKSEESTESRAAEEISTSTEETVAADDAPAKSESAAGDSTEAAAKEAPKADESTEGGKSAEATQATE